MKHEFDHNKLKRYASEVEKMLLSSKSMHVNCFDAVTNHKNWDCKMGGIFYSSDRCFNSAMCGLRRFMNKSAFTTYISFEKLENNVYMPLVIHDSIRDIDITYGYVVKASDYLHGV